MSTRRRLASRRNRGGRPWSTSNPQSGSQPASAPSSSSQASGEHHQGAAPAAPAKRPVSPPGPDGTVGSHGSSERRRGARGMCRGRDSARDHQPVKARLHDSAFDERQAEQRTQAATTRRDTTALNLNDVRRRPQHLQPPGPAAIAVCRLCRRRPQPNQQPARRRARPPRRRRCAKQTPKDKQRAARSHPKPLEQAKANR